MRRPSCAQCLFLAIFDPQNRPMEKFEETRKYLTNKLPPGWTPQLAIVCGSGLGGLVETLEPVSANDSKPIELHYVDIPNFARSTGEIFSRVCF